ncbi:MAG: AmmeMemoRadiSam system radical SAM enzyme [bacterium]
MNDYEECLRGYTEKNNELVDRVDDGVRCFACGHNCMIKVGQSGICRMRYNEGGELYVPWDYVSSLSVDPMEKKPFFHAYPGQEALSYGMLGCNMHCPYCQNWQISQTVRDSTATVFPRRIKPHEIIEQARKAGVDTVIATYNEPLITSEWNRKVFELARQEGMKTGYVSNGYATPRVLDYLQPVTDLFNVDFKTSSPEHYRKLGADIEVVKDSIRRIYEMGIHLEVITLLVPGQSDSPDNIDNIADFLLSVSPDIPWHLTAFRGAYKWRDRPSTSVASLRRAFETASSSGMKYVYCGNLPGSIKDGENTYCSDCGELLIARTGYSIRNNYMSGSNCPGCGSKIYGRYV